MIVASIIHKLSPFYSFGRWFITHRLNYYTVPMDTVLITHVESESIKKSKSLPLIDSALLKRSSPFIPLNSSPLNSVVILLTYCYTELKWLLDLLLAVIFVYIVTFIIYLIKPAWYVSQMNLSGAWCGFILIYSLTLLYSLTRIYLSKELPKERISQVVLTLCLLVCCLSFVPMDNMYFNFRFRSGHKMLLDAVLTTLSLAKNDSSFSLDKSTLEYYLPFWVYITLLATVSMCIGTVLIFPSLNYSKLHYETLSKTKGFISRTVLHFNYIYPLLGLSLWLKPITIKPKRPSEVPIEVGSLFPQYRLILIVSFTIFRFLLFHKHMRTYMSRANTSLSALRSVKNKPTVGDFKRKVKSIFTFYGGTCLQYLGPLIVLLSFQLLDVISSGYIGMFPPSENVPVNVFNLSVYQVPLSFLCWWVLFVMFFMSSLGSAVYTVMMEPHY